MGKDPWCLSPQFTAVKRGAGRLVGVGRYRWGSWYLSGFTAICRSSEGRGRTVGVDRYPWGRWYLSPGFAAALGGGEER